MASHAELGSDGFRLLVEVCWALFGAACSDPMEKEAPTPPLAPREGCVSGRVPLCVCCRANLGPDLMFVISG